MNCAAAATEISQHLNKFPVPLTEETGGGEKPRYVCSFHELSHDIEKFEKMNAG